MACWRLTAMKLDLQVRPAEQRAVFIHQTRCSHAAVFGVEFDADAVSAGFEGGDHGGCGAAERVNDGVANEGEHLYQPRCKLERERRRMYRCSPSLATPSLTRSAAPQPPWSPPSKPAE